MKRTSGSVLGFIIVGVILVGLLTGGVYFISHQKPGVAAPQIRKPATLKPDKKPSSSNQPAAVSKNEDSTPEAAPVTTQLPQTGITETLGTLLGLGALSGVIASYLRSRRQFTSL
jgi:LPXTG-motif cell wall-anchored protein